MSVLSLGEFATRIDNTAVDRSKYFSGQVGLLMFTFRKELPIAVQEVYPTVVGDNIFLAGGVVAIQEPARLATDKCFVYDRMADCWLTAPRLPEPLHHPYLVATESTVLAIGGFNASSSMAPLAWTMRDTVLKLTVNQSGLWTPGPALPGPRAEFSAGVVEGRVVIAGGRTPRSGNNGRYKDHVDTSTTLLLAADGRSWLPREAMPTARNSAAAAVLDRRLHVIGGRRVTDPKTGDSINLHAHEAYDLDNNKWTVLQEIPQATAGAAAASWQGCIYVFGGEQWSPREEAFATIWKYDPSSKDGWTRAEDMPATRHGLGAVALLDGIHLLGGATGANMEGTCNYHTVFNP